MRASRITALALFAAAAGAAPAPEALRWRAAEPVAYRVRVLETQSVEGAVEGSRRIEMTLHWKLEPIEGRFDDAPVRWIVYLTSASVSTASGAGRATRDGVIGGAPLNRSRLTRAIQSRMAEAHVLAMEEDGKVVRLRPVGYAPAVHGRLLSRRERVLFERVFGAEGVRDQLTRLFQALPPDGAPAATWTVEQQVDLPLVGSVRRSTACRVVDRTGARVGIEMRPTLVFGEGAAGDVVVDLLDQRGSGYTVFDEVGGRVEHAETDHWMRLRTAIRSPKRDEESLVAVHEVRKQVALDRRPSDPERETRATP
jgi:hypothetical protein